MDAQRCGIGLEYSGYQRLLDTFRGVLVYQHLSGSMELVAIVDEELAATVDTWQLMNIRNEIIRQVGNFDLLFLIFSYNTELTADHIAADHGHWIYDDARDKILIYNDQPQSFHDLEKVLVQLRTLPVRKKERKQVQKNDIITVTNLMVFLNVLVFLVGMFLTHKYGYEILEEYGAMFVHIPQYDNQFYRLFTNMFLHSGIQHLAGNMITLFFVGKYLENAIGHGKFAIIYLVGGLVGSVVSYVYYDMSSSGPVCMLGASGAIFSVIGAYLYVLIRNRKSIRRSTLPRFLIYIGLSIYMGATTTGISLSAHLGGLVAGFLLALLLYHKKNENNTIW